MSLFVSRIDSISLGLHEAVRAKSVAAANRLLAHTMALRDLYKKAHWQTSGPSFYELHLLFDKHYGEQAELMDTLAERVQTLGGVALALAHDVVEEVASRARPEGASPPPISCGACSTRTKSYSRKHALSHAKSQSEEMMERTT
jgi:hypothetical protein